MKTVGFDYVIPRLEMNKVAKREDWPKGTFIFKKSSLRNEFDLNSGPSILKHYLINKKEIFENNLILMVRDGCIIDLWIPTYDDIFMKDWIVVSKIADLDKL